jgi:predicted RNA-binding Zn ribbon-like protein
MPSDIRDGFKFRGGSVALDFAATLRARLSDTPLEMLATPRDLARWFVAAELAPRKLPVTDSDVRSARKLREAIYRLAIARIDDEPFADRDRALLNRFASAPPPALRLERDGIGIARADVATLLSLIARTAIELLGGASSDRIRRCSSGGCAILFVDTSRSGERRWCSMAGCGNKAKVASFRERAM